LYKLPQELRDEIYLQVFSSQELKFTSKGEVRRPRSKNLLALVSTCHQIRFEIGDSWLKHVWFSFGDMVTLLDVLTAIPSQRLSNIRNLHISRPYPLVLSRLNEAVENGIATRMIQPYRLNGVLRLLPGLRLDKFVVHAGFQLGDNTESHILYDILDELIRTSNGWKELHFLTPDPNLLSWKAVPQPNSTGDEPRRMGPQPQYWREALAVRDGTRSESSVAIYLEPDVGPSHRGRAGLRFEQTLPDWLSTTDYGYVEDAFLVLETRLQQGLKTHVVVKRGKGVDYEEKLGSPFVKHDIRLDHPGKDWERLRDNYIEPW
jgi:hypothetical protein